MSSSHQTHPVSGHFLWLRGLLKVATREERHQKEKQLWNGVRGPARLLVGGAWPWSIFLQFLTHVAPSLTVQITPDSGSYSVLSPYVLHCGFNEPWIEYVCMYACMYVSIIYHHFFETESHYVDQACPTVQPLYTEFWDYFSKTLLLLNLCGFIVVSAFTQWTIFQHCPCPPSFLSESGAFVAQASARLAL